MAGRARLAFGALARCTDGVCGAVSRVIIDPDARTVTHLVVEPERARDPSRLVAVGLIDAADGGIRLRCSLAEFGGLDPAEETELVEGVDGIGIGGMPTATGIPSAVQAVVEDVVPDGETEVVRGEHVRALDGEIGRVRGFVVDPGEDYRVTHVLLGEGHLWSRKDVAIPASAVAGMANGIRLSLTRRQVENLPPVS